MYEKHGGGQVISVRAPFLDILAHTRTHDNLWNVFLAALLQLFWQTSQIVGILVVTFQLNF